MQLNVFFSWQVETEPQGFDNKKFLMQCIQEALSKIKRTQEFKGVKFNLCEGLRNIAGTPAVSSEMFRQIDECDIFIGDLTVVQRFCDDVEKMRANKKVFYRYTPNCNVYGEFNRALGKYPSFEKQVIILMNEANKTSYDDPCVIPFDTRERRWAITFRLDSNSKKEWNKAKKSLVSTLYEAIHKSAKEAINHCDNQFRPFENWFKQSKDGNLRKIKVEEDLLKACQKLIFNRPRINIIEGLSGFNKTLLVLKSFEGTEFINDYFYVNSWDYKYDEYKEILAQIFEKHGREIIVVDNCQETDFKNIVRLRKKHNSGNRFIAIVENGFNTSVYENNAKISHLDISVNEQKLRNLELSQQKELPDESLEKVQIGLPYFRKNSGINEISDCSCVQFGALFAGANFSDVEHIMFQTLCLFDSVGFSDERSDELEYLMTEKNITPVEIENSLLLIKARYMIKEAIQRGYVQIKGRTICIPSEAIYIPYMSEWLSSIDNSRFLNFINSLLNSPKNRLLSDEFCKRFKFMGRYQEAKDLVASVLSIRSNLNSAEFWSTYNGSLFIEAFAQVNPIAVADFLIRVVNSIAIEELEKLDLAWSNIISTVAKLCFIPETFSKGAQVLMHLSLVPDESFLNNSKAEFIQLFPIFLPATAADLDIRIKFIREYIHCEEYKPLLMSCLKRALTPRDYILLDGPNIIGKDKLTPYVPQNSTEITTYIEECLDLVMNEIRRKSSVFDLGIDILETCTVILCKQHYAKIVLPALDEICDIKNNSWDKMRQVLFMFKNDIFNILSDEEQSLYIKILGQITHQDPLSQFSRIEKDSYVNNKNLSFEERLKFQQREYEKLAVTIMTESLLNVNLLRDLACVDCINSNPFGKTLCSLANAEEQKKFIHEYIRILNENEKAKPDILLDYISELDPGVFADVLETLKTSRISYLVFACFGLRGIKPGSKMFAQMRGLIESGRSLADDYLQYWTRIPILSFTEEEMRLFFNEVLSCKGFLVVLRMGSYLFLSNEIKHFSGIPSILEQAILNYSEENLVVSSDVAMHVVELLLKNDDRNALASFINNQVIEYAKQKQTYFVSTFEMESIYTILMEKYFGIIWADLSTALLASGEDFMTFYHMKEILGVSIVNENKAIILQGNHFDDMITWCKSFPDIAPVRLASMIPVIGENEHFSAEALILIDMFADNDLVLNEIGCNLDSFSAIGSIVPYYETRKRIYSTLLKHEKANVREWAQKRVNSCEYFISLESEREQEDFGMCYQ